MNRKYLHDTQLSIPYNGDPDLPGRLISSPFRRNIREIYFAGNPCIIPSGRRPKIKHFIRTTHSTASFDSNNYDLHLIKMLHFFNAQSVRCNLLLNFDLPLTVEIFKYIDLLVDNGVSAVTVGTTQILDQVFRRYGNTLAIQNSVYISARSLQSLTKLIDAGVKILLVPPDYNHDTDFLDKLSGSVSSRSVELKVMVNEGCIINCRHRLKDLKEAQTYPIHLTIHDYLTNPAEFRKLSTPCRGYFGKMGIAKSNYIHPNDVAKLAYLKPLLKIVGRSFSTDVVLSICEAYVTGQYKGDLRMLIENFKHASSPVEHNPQGRVCF